MLWQKTASAIKNAAEKSLCLEARTKRSVKDSPELRRLSQAQKELELRIENITNTGTQAGLKKERNRILHSIRRTALKEAELRLDEKAKEVEKLRDGARMFKAVQLMRRRGAVKPTVANNTGKIIVGWLVGIFYFTSPE